MCGHQWRDRAVLQSFIWEWQHNAITFRRQLLWLGWDSRRSWSYMLETRCECPSSEVSGFQFQGFWGEIKLVSQTPNLRFGLVKCTKCRRPLDEGRKVAHFCYITPEMCCSCCIIRKSFPVLGKEKISPPDLQKSLWSNSAHTLLSKPNENSTYPLKRLIKVIVGQ